MKKKRPRTKLGLFGHKVMISGLVLVLLLYAAAAYKLFHVKPATLRTASEGPVPVYYRRAEDAMPFPATLDPVKFKRADIREAYEVAKEIPGVLARQPCYCYCQRQGHRSLLDCFKTEHAASCSICIREALLAGQMHRAGKTPEQIRLAIVQGQWGNVGNPT